MLLRLSPKRRWHIYAFIAVHMLSLSFIGCADETRQTAQAEQSGTTPHVASERTVVIELGSAGMNERIFNADVIARVRLIDTEATAEPAGTNEHGKDIYRGLVEFRFRVMEYLKGTGGDELVVVTTVELKPEVIKSIMDRNARGEFVTWSAVDHENPYTTMDLALEAARTWEQDRDTYWDDREAIILARAVAVPGSSDGSKRYFFGYIVDYALDSTYRIWLPSAPEVGVKDGAERASPDDQLFLLEVPDSISTSGVSVESSAQPETVSVSEMKALIAKLDKWLKEGEGVEGYLECIRDSFLRERDLNGYRERGESLYTTYDFYFASSLPAGTVLNEPLPTDGKWWLGGKDNAFVGFESGTLHTTRPLPTGEYRFFISYQMPTSIPCNYHPDEYKTMYENFIHVTAPEGTLHEAFFDPVGVGSAIGAGGADGVLKPDSFTTDDGADTAIERIHWESGKVVVRLNPHTQLADHHLDFIALDGSVILRLDFDDAVESEGAADLSLTWGVCTQPWVPGDKLMLRISQSEPDLTDATNDPSCPSGP